MKSLRSSSLLFLAGPLVLLGVGCHAPSVGTTEGATLGALIVAADDEEANAEGDAKAGEERDVAALTRQLTLGRERLKRAEADLAIHEEEIDVDRRLADAELELAQQKLVQFDVDAKSRIAEAELELQSAKDEATEAKEELEQIEVMYTERDLDDRTAEFVVNRGRRNAERAATKIAIEEEKLAALKELQVPRERREISLEVERQTVEIAKQVRQGELALMDARIQVLESRQEVERLEGEIAKATASGDAEKK